MGTGSGASLVGILPLLAAGFIFNHVFYTTRFWLSKADGQRLFFTSVVSGFSIGCLAFVACAMLRGYIPSNSWLRHSMDWFHGIIPIPHGLTFIATILLALLLGYVANGGLWIRKRIFSHGDARRVSVWAYWMSMSEHVSALDELVRRAVSSDSLVLICLKSRKVYCGVIAGVRGMHESGVTHIQLIPAFSITRHKDTLKFDAETRTQYRAHALKGIFDRKTTLDNSIRNAARLVHALKRGRYSAIRDESLRAGFIDAVKRRGRASIADRKKLVAILEPYGASRSFDISHWIKVIPASEIESASLFKDDDYGKWFSSAGQG